MENLISIPVQRSLRVGLAALAVAAGTAKAIGADAIPYPNSGTPNPVTYTFTAAATGPITAYFAGSSASHDNELGMLVNGVSTGIIGLDDHTAAFGQSLVLGNVTAGDTLVFALIDNTLGLTAYSDPSLNGAYDTDGSMGHNHVYSTPYTATSPIIDSIPVGTYVAFEDLQFPNSDFNYNDEDFVFTNLAPGKRGVPDSASTLTLLSMGFAGVSFRRRRTRG